MPARHRSNYVPATGPAPGVENARETPDGATRTPATPTAAGLTRRELRAREAAVTAAPASQHNRTEEPPATTGPTRREVRGTELLESDVTPARHLRTRRAAWIRAGFGLVAAAALLIGGTMAITAAVTTPMKTTATRTVADEPDPVPLPESVAAIPAPSSSAVPALVDVCANPEFVAAIGAGDDTTALALAGGAEPFRAAVAAGTAPCVPLDDPAHVWVLVNKTRPYDPIDYRPSPLGAPAAVRDISGGSLRTDAAAALTTMVAAAKTAGAGEIALDSGYRSYRTQQSTYGAQVSANGRAHADTVSARPGYSEHQSGLAADVTACSGGCVGLESFAGTAQQQWVAAHSWEFGWIVRYEDGYTDITGYSPEPWHLRYLGPELAAEYHAGAWHTLEQFLGMPAAPDYVG